MFLLNRLRARSHRSPTRHRPGARGRSSRAHPLTLETLEDRCLLSSYSFTLLADDGPNSPFTLVAPPGTTINNQGTVRFRSALRSGGEGIFTRDTQGNLGIIAITSDLI